MKKIRGATLRKLLSKPRQPGELLLEPLQLLLLFSLFLLLLAPALLAADLSRSPGGQAIFAPAVQQQALFHGFYLGLNGSYVEVEVEEAFSAGGHLGYNWQFKGGVVAGLEADLSRVFFDDSKLPDAWASTLRGRLGYAAGPVMPYVTAGWGFVKLDNVATSLDGPVYGAGVELAATTALLLRVEYLRFDLDPVTADVVRGGFSLKF